MYMRTIPSKKLSNFRKRKIHIAQHHTPNVIYVCVLSHVNWKSRERPADVSNSASEKQKLWKGWKQGNISKESIYNQRKK